MKISSLAKLISGELTPVDYSAEILDELAEHTRGLKKRGGVAPVQVTQDTNLRFDRAALGALCRLFASGQLTAGELAYTADALQLSESVEIAGQYIANDLSECTDPEINGPLTVARALELASVGAAA